MSTAFLFSRYSMTSFGSIPNLLKDSPLIKVLSFSMSHLPVHLCSRVPIIGEHAFAFKVNFSNIDKVQGVNSLGGKVINTFFFNDDHAIIEVTTSKREVYEIAIDFEMVEKIKSSGANIRFKNKTPYCCFVDKNPIILSHFILDKNEHKAVVKYNNGNPLDLRIDNITRKDRPPLGERETNIPGVYRCRRTLKWGASFDYKKETYFLGLFDSEVLAVSAVIMKRFEILDKK